MLKFCKKNKSETSLNCLNFNIEDFNKKNKRNIFDSFKLPKVIEEVSEVYDGSDNTLSNAQRKKSINMTKFLIVTTKNFYTDFHVDNAGEGLYFYINEVCLILFYSLIKIKFQIFIFQREKKFFFSFPLTNLFKKMLKKIIII